MSTIQNHIELTLREAKALVDLDAADQKKRHREGQITQLAAVREEKRVIKPRFQATRAQHYRDKENLDNAQAAINRQQTRIDDSWTERPACADYLPNDVDVVRWRQAHEALERKQDQLIAQRDALPDPERAREEAIRLNWRVVELELAEQNLINAIAGRSGIIRFEGGVSGVR